MAVVPEMQQPRQRVSRDKVKLLAQYTVVYGENPLCGDCKPCLYFSNTLWYSVINTVNVPGVYIVANPNLVKTR